MMQHAFVLVDPANHVVGTFGSEPALNPRNVLAPGAPPRSVYHLVLRDPSGRIIRTPDNPTKLMPLSSR